MKKYSKLKDIMAFWAMEKCCETRTHFLEKKYWGDSCAAEGRTKKGTPPNLFLASSLYILYLSSFDYTVQTIFVQSSKFGQYIELIQTLRFMLIYS